MAKDETPNLPAILKQAEALPCRTPRHEPAEYVTRDMAIDAGEPTMEGTLLRGELWEPCQDCDYCHLRANVPVLVKALEEVQGKLDAVWLEVEPLLESGYAPSGEDGRVLIKALARILKEEK